MSAVFCFPLLGQDVEDFNRTVAYTDQDGRIKLFRVTARELAASSIWENPLLLPRDTQPAAGAVRPERQYFLARTVRSVVLVSCSHQCFF
jgi:alpha-1,4-galacturonosyltransferase